MKINPTFLLLIFRFGFVLALSITTYAALIDVAELPPITLRVWDKLQHASVFLLLSFLLHRSFVDKRLFSTPHIAQMAFLFGYGVLIEWLQSYTPHREASAADVLADTFGIFCYSLLYFKICTGKRSSPGG